MQKAVFYSISKRKAGYRANLQFIVKLHTRDVDILHGFKAFLMM